jgi:hypothetical protein
LQRINIKTIKIQTYNCLICKARSQIQVSDWAIHSFPRTPLYSLLHCPHLPSWHSVPHVPFLFANTNWPLMLSPLTSFRKTDTSPRAQEIHMLHRQRASDAVGFTLRNQTAVDPSLLLSTGLWSARGTRDSK